MGTWGVALFSDDLAADVRSDFRELVAESNSASKATKALSAEYKESLADPNESSVFWLALAATQWELGVLELKVKSKALRIINDGTELGRWAEDKKLMQQRAAVLIELKEKLSSPQPAPKKLRRVRKAASKHEIGEILSYQLKSGRLALFRVIGHHTDKGGRFDICELLDWVGNDLPSVEQMSKIGIRREANKRAISQFVLGEPQGKGKDRLVDLNLKTAPTQTPERYTAFPWRFLDQLLDNIFEMD